MNTGTAFADTLDSNVTRRQYEHNMGGKSVIAKTAGNPQQSIPYNSV